MREWIIAYKQKEETQWSKFGLYLGEEPEDALDDAFDKRPERAAQVLLNEDTEVRAESTDLKILRTEDSEIQAEPETTVEGEDLFEGTDFYPA